MYQHIIAALDGSSNSDKALLEAIRIAKFCKASLTLFHIASLRDLAVEGVGLLGTHELHDQAFRDGNRVLEQARKQAVEAGVEQVQIHMAESWDGGADMAELLVRYADSHNANLVVLGTHGRSGIAHLLLGSFAQNLLRRANCPVMVLRSEQSEFGQAE
ncbi:MULTISPECIES: universal stress protein [Chromobacterium]|uniref:Universal stress protein n=1 Tax=Chromobacterium haemolyticum TaxID=394935 RepID=A0A1W0D2Y0_9NEIS|nr:MULTISPECIES: universal stress protein [Chromobacterium]OQS41293.1 hypothetical protein B0T45_08345 [Chromobacterium haemolyticum]QOZ81791.1 universal stress protein [Chromobacterium sp. Rain0013]WON81782.1 universal stress protein [Chromobacterium haemolyticum]